MTRRYTRPATVIASAPPIARRPIAWYALRYGTGRGESSSRSPINNHAEQILADTACDQPGVGLMARVLSLLNPDSLKFRKEVKD